MMQRAFLMLRQAQHEETGTLPFVCAHPVIPGEYRLHSRRYEGRESRPFNRAAITTWIPFPHAASSMRRSPGMTVGGALGWGMTGECDAASHPGRTTLPLTIVEL